MRTKTNRFDTVQRIVVLTLMIAHPWSTSSLPAEELEAEEMHSRSLLPSEALVLVNYQKNRYPLRGQQAIVRPLLARTKRSDLDESERLALAELHFRHFDVPEARAGFESFLDKKGLVGRTANQRVLQIRFAALGLHEPVRREVYEYRKRFPPISADRFHLHQQIANLATRFSSAGQHETAVRVIQDELASLDFSAPFVSYKLPTRFFASFQAIGREAEACDSLEATLRGLREAPERPPIPRWYDRSRRTESRLRPPRFSSRREPHLGRTLSAVPTPDLGARRICDGSLRSVGGSGQRDGLGFTPALTGSDST